MEDFALSVIEAVLASMAPGMLQRLGPRYGIDADQMLGALGRFDEFSERGRSILAHTVLPNLKQLGLMTDRTESDYQRLGLTRRRSGGEGTADRGGP